MPQRARPKSNPPVPSSSLPSAVWRAGLIVLAGLVIYANSLSGPFVFDDGNAIVGNPAIRSLGGVFSDRADSPLAGRPVAGLTFAINFALHGLDVVGYHSVNITIHILCALLLFGIARRALTSPRLRDKYGAAGSDLAFAVALVWTVHPLNTEAVSYVTERTESLMALFYLLTLYASIRSLALKTSSGWQALAVVSCALGMGSKESMVTAPLIVVFYDRIFVFDSLRDAFEKRWRLYGSLALTWVVLAYVILPGPRSGSAGFSTEVHPWTYLLNQAAMIVRYLRLAIWPSDLVLQYGPPVPLTLGDVLPHSAAVFALLLATLAALRWKPAAGFLAAWVFITLAPSSSFVPIATEVGAERRMYLPLMAIIALMVIGLYRLESLRRRVPQNAAFAALAVVSVALGMATIARNREFQSGLSLARATLARWPTDFAHGAVGSELALLKRDEEALPELRIGARSDPRARYNLGITLFNRQQFEEAIRELDILVREHPRRQEVPSSRRVMGHAYALLRKWPEAITQFRLALSMIPGDMETRGLLVESLNGQGIELGLTGKYAEAVAAFRQALQMDPDNAGVRHNLARTLLDGGDLAGALAEARQAVALNPSDAASYNLIGRALALQGNLDEAIAQLEHALLLTPDDPAIKDDLNRVRGVRKQGR